MVINERNILDRDDDDLEDILNEVDAMGFTEIEALEKCLEQRLRDEGVQLDDNLYAADDDSLFSDLSIDYIRRPFQTKHSQEDNAVYNSPIRPKRYSQRRSTESPSSCFDFDREAIRSFDPESSNLIDRTERSLFTLYKTLDEIDKLEEEINKLPGPKHIPKYNNALQKEKPVEVTADVSPEESVKLSVSIESHKPVQPVKTLNKCLRFVPAPAPGRTLYKHDPVTSYQIYMEEWKRRPTPEEQKRLSLRWKVRDYMMSRKFIPKKQPTGQPLQHSKDWSPKPYLD